MLTSRSIVAPCAMPARSPIVTNGAIVTPRLDLHEAVDDDLAVEDVEPRRDDDRVADRDLRERHREPVGEPRERRDAERLEPGLQAVARLARGTRR